ncbi:hypothetical protein QCA50_006399 [Cerrena zonata]|uniref:F-box domain-containing protein n=1 Tax=Cerrena zonata TaxID=2478898 RepID=A0AAW0G8L5_9APHY
MGYAFLACCIPGRRNSPQSSTDSRVKKGRQLLLSSEPNWQHPFLPIELIFQIIEHAYDDLDTAKSCALLCKICLPIAQAILFERIKVQLPAQDVSVHTIHEHIASLVSHVRCLTLESIPFQKNALHALKLKDLVSITSLIPNLKKLRLNNLCLNFNGIVSSDNQDMSLPRQDSVKTVELRHLTILRLSPGENHQPTIFEYLFTSFPAIQHLICVDIKNIRPSHRMASADILAVPLRSLSYHGMNNFGSFFESIRPFLNSIEIIDYAPYYGLSEFDEFRLLCESVSPKRLKVLRICIQPRTQLCTYTIRFQFDARLMVNNPDGRNPAHPENFWRTMGWQNYTTLHTIHIVIGMPTALFVSHISILPFLPQSIRTIVFELAWNEVVESEPSLKWLDAPYMEKCVEEGLPSLEEIVFMPHYLGHTFTPLAQSSIRARLAILDARGLLRIASVCKTVDWWQYEKPIRTYSQLGTRLT